MASICPPAIILEQEVDVEVILRTCRTLVFFLAVRGAPAIGVAAAYGVVLGARSILDGAGGKPFLDGRAGDLHES